MMRTLKYLAVVLGLAACTPSPVVAAPAPFALPLAVMADTVKLSIPCAAEEPTVACRITLTGNVAGTAIVFPALADVQVGQSASVNATFTGTPLQVVTVNAESRGVNRSGQLSAPQTASATALVPDGAPNVPRTFTITITVVRP